jgi:hypothetical protein
MPWLKDEENPPGDADIPSPLLPSPGRDSSRLMQDLIDHGFADPQLHTHPPYFDPTKRHSFVESSHSHSWVMKSREAIKARPWNTPYGDSSINVICEICRIHMSLVAIVNGDSPAKCGSQESERKSHHFHVESWTSTTRYSSASTPIEQRPELGTFQCCQCPLALKIEFWHPAVPEYLFSSIGRRKTNSSLSPNIINRGKDQKSLQKASVTPSNAFGTLSIYCTDVLNRGGTKPAREINISSDSPFARRVGLDPDVIKFMEHLGWSRREEGHTMLFPPQWDEHLERGRISRKLLERAEIELVAICIEATRDTDKNDRIGMTFGV